MFKVGDRVICIEDSEGNSKLTGKVATIIYISESNRPLLQFDEYFMGHSGYGRGKHGHCWWSSWMDLKLHETLSTEQKVLRKVKQMDEKFKNKTLPKVCVSSLPLP